MPLKRLAVLGTALLLGLGLATSAQADKIFSLTGGGGQLHIGNGLQLPIQAAATGGQTGTVFPPLLIPPNAVPKILGTVAKPLIGPTGMGKQGYQRRLSIPKGVLSKPGILKTVGVKFSNPTVFAVATNIKYTWPAAPAVFSTGAVVGPATIPTVGTTFGGSMTYSNGLGSRFGGPAQFRLASGGAAGIIGPPVTVYIKVNATTPPCTHPAFLGPNAACVAGILHALPTGLAAIGADPAATYTTPGGPVVGMNVAIVKMGAVPLGQVLAKALVATNTAIPTNMATSQPGPWTTGKVIITNMAASPAETFTLSGKDSRTAGGGGSIQFVAGSLSARTASGPNANRGWLTLVLATAAPVPAMSLTGLAATVALILLGFGYATRRRLFS